MNLKNKKGVTLVELLVALAIISVALVPIINTFIFVLRYSIGDNTFTKAVLAAKSIMTDLTLPSTSYASLANNGSAETPNVSEDYPDIRWYSVVDEITSADHHPYKKIVLYINYPRAGDIDGATINFVTYRYDFD